MLHELRWRKEISGELASIALERLAAADVSPRRPKGLTKRRGALPTAWGGPRPTTRNTSPGHGC